MKNLILIATIVLTMVIVSSCSKEDGLVDENKSSKSMTNARINPEMTSEEVEKNILVFMDKLEHPGSYERMNYEEAFEYVEAALNFQYVNYDYSKCANTERFNGDVQFTLEDGETIEMDQLKEIYDVILEDWREKYYSVEDEIKTPIVFNITDISSTGVKYEMEVGYGSLDLEYWGKKSAPADSTYWITAGNQMHWQINAFLSNYQIALYNPGAGFQRVFITNVGNILYNHTDYPSNPSTALVYPEPLPPLTNGYTDYRLFTSDMNGLEYHQYINAAEYDYHRAMMFVFLTESIHVDPMQNYVSYARVDSYGIFPSYQVIGHRLRVTMGRHYITSTPIITL